VNAALQKRQPSLHAMALAIGLAVTPYYASAQATTAVTVQIPATTLSQALTQLGQQAKVQILFSQQVVEGKTSTAIGGNLSVDAALERLLSGTGLTAVSTGRGYVIQPVSAANATELTTITVAAGNDGVSTEGTGSYTTKKTSIGKMEQSLREIPQTVSVITRQRLDDQNITNAKQAMASAPGVNVTSNGAYAQTGFQIRGYDALQQQDGLSVGGGESYTIAPPRDMEIYDRIEILRGPSGLLEGSGDPGGVINYVRKRPQAEFGGTASVSVGSWNNVRASASLTGALNEAKTVRGRVIAVQQNRDYFYDVAKDSRSLFYGVAEFDLTPATLLSVSASYTRSSSVPFYGLPAGANDVPRGTFMGANWNKIEVPQQIEALADLTHTFDNGWKGRAAAYYQQSELKARMGLAASNINLVAGTADYGAAAIRDETDIVGAEVGLSGPFQLFGRTHQAAVGATLSQIETDASSQWNGAAGNYSLINPSISQSTLLSTENSRTKTLTTKSGIYGVGKFKVADPVTVIIGGRFSNYEQKSRGTGLLNQSDWKKSTAEASWKFTPYGGVVWDISPTISAYASYVDIFAPQTQKDKNDNVLDPRIGWQAEAGVKGEFYDGRLNAALSFFRIRDTNRAMVDPDNLLGCNGGACYIAAGLQQTQGWDMEINGRVTPNWDVSASYVYMKAEVLQAASAASIGTNFAPRTPEHMLRLWNTYRFGQTGWQVGGGANIRSKLEDKASNLRNPGVAVFNALVGYRVNSHWQVNLNINNLFDRKYFEGMGYAANRWFYGEPRNFMLTVRATY
jgi:outer membrane receptor for ferric coprogen and ferric-rhodotorulic acid